MATVLIVDDDPDIRTILKRIVIGRGHHALTAENTTEAEAQLQAKPDLMLLDVDMPGETGVELVTKMRRGIVKPDTPVVFVTAHPARTGPLQATGVGALAVLHKPFRMEQVVDVLTRFLPA